MGERDLTVQYFYVEGDDRSAYHLKIECPGYFRVSGLRFGDGVTSREELLKTMGSMFSKAFCLGKVVRYENGFNTNSSRIKPLSEDEEQLLLKALRGDYDE